MLKDLYFSSPVHFSAYFIGLAIGYYARMSVLRQSIIPKVGSPLLQCDPLMFMYAHICPQPLRYLLWLLLPLLSLLAVYLPQHWPVKDSFKYARTATALYYANYRLAFIVTFAWVLFEGIHNRAGKKLACYRSTVN